MDKQERIAKSIERSTSDDLHADVREVFPGELKMMLDDNPDLDIDAWADIMDRHLARLYRKHRQWRKCRH